jgi:hypothetical protein
MCPTRATKGGTGFAGATFFAQIAGEACPREACPREACPREGGERGAGIKSERPELPETFKFPRPLVGWTFYPAIALATADGPPSK